MRTSNYTKKIVTLSIKALVLGVSLILSTVSFAQSGNSGSGSSNSGSGNSGSGNSGSGSSNSGSGGGKLTFRKPNLISGNNGANGATYKFDNIGNNLDAVVKITGRSDALVKLVNIDMSGSGFDKAWQPQVGYNNGRTSKAAEWWMEFEVSFVDRKTMNPAMVEKFDLTAIDIDGNGDKIREYVSFYGLQSYLLESVSTIKVAKVTSIVNGVTSVLGARFDGPFTNYLDVDTLGTSVMTTTRYAKVQSFKVRTGAVATGANGAADRMYSLYFRDFEYVQPVAATLPVKLTSFDSKLVSSKVVLDWACSEQINFSHFIVERSINGKDFNQVTMIFGNENPSEYKYSYSEAVNANAAGLIYYRLKMVDIDGSAKYSAIRIIKLNNQKNSQIAISTYPNPVTSEIRITIPANWQNKKVTYDMISLNGVVVKHVVNGNASQTESVQVNDLKPGTYVVRLNAGSESATQMIVKK
jgi:Secretion system C-terminal sorting domain